MIRAGPLLLVRLHGGLGVASSVLSKGTECVENSPLGEQRPLFHTRIAGVTDTLRVDSTHIPVLFVRVFLLPNAVTKDAQSRCGKGLCLVRLGSGLGVERVRSGKAQGLGKWLRKVSRNGGLDPTAQPGWEAGTHRRAQAVFSGPADPAEGSDARHQVCVEGQWGSSSNWAKTTTGREEQDNRFLSTVAWPVGAGGSSSEQKCRLTWAEHWGLRTPGLQSYSRVVDTAPGPGLCSVHLEESRAEGNREPSSSTARPLPQGLGS
ncbi:hypothetical protein CB1_000270011 [Camelus ferus]|nr:hypothetical protein CB1_000270011 [Camelus ferus]